MLRKVLAAGAVALAATLSLGVPSASAATDSKSSTQHAVTTSAPRSTLAQRAGQLDFALDGYSCRSTGGSLGHGFVGARGYMDELGATNVTSMKIAIVAQAKYTTAPTWRNVPGTTATYVYNFAGSPNSASHSLTGPAPGLVWSYNFSANDDANNFIYRMKLAFTWSNPSSVVKRTITTAACFSN